MGGASRLWGGVPSRSFIPSLTWGVGGLWVVYGFGVLVGPGQAKTWPFVGDAGVAGLSFEGP